MGYRVPKKDLLDDIRRLADDLDRAPTSYEYRNLGRFSTQPAYRYFESWSDAVEEAGLEPRDNRSAYNLESMEPEDLGLSPKGDVPHS